MVDMDCSVTFVYKLVGSYETNGAIPSSSDFKLLVFSIYHARGYSKRFTVTHAH
jgi:hypothetical protein